MRQYLLFMDDMVVAEGGAKVPDGDGAVMEDGAAVEISPSARWMHLRIRPPPGHKWITGAEHEVQLASTDDEVLHIPPWAFPDLSFDWRIPIEPRKEGRAGVRIHGMLFFCPVADEMVCLFDMLDVTVPVLVEEGGDYVLEVEHTASPA